MIKFLTSLDDFTMSIFNFSELESKLRLRSQYLISTLSGKIKNGIRLNEEVCKKLSIHVNNLKIDFINYHSSLNSISDDVIVVKSSVEKFSASDLYRLKKSKTLHSTLISNNYNLSTGDEYVIHQLLKEYTLFVNSDKFNIDYYIEEVVRLSNILCNVKSSKLEEEGEESSYETEEYNIDTIENMKYPKSIRQKLNFKFNYDEAVFDVLHIDMGEGDPDEGITKTRLRFNKCVEV